MGKVIVRRVKVASGRRGRGGGGGAAAAAAAAAAVEAAVVRVQAWWRGHLTRLALGEYFLEEFERERLAQQFMYRAAELLGVEKLLLEEEMEETRELIKAARCDAPMTPIRMNILVDDVGGDAISAALGELLRGQGEIGEHLPARAPRRKRCARHLPAQRRPQPRCPRHRAARPPYIH